MVNEFISSHDVASIIEFGCGDGHQLSMIQAPTYLGLDVSRSAIDLCERRFDHDASKHFILYDPPSFTENHHELSAELGLSLDVIYHLVEDDVFELYMLHLFSAAERYVIIYSVNSEAPSAVPYTRARTFTDWVERHALEWTLLRIISNPFPTGRGEPDESWADFYIYEKRAASSR